MSDATIVEILLAVLALVVSYGSYLGASKASKSPAAVASPSDIDADAYERAKGIYESAISALEGHVSRLREQMEILDAEISKLQKSNRELYLNNVELTSQVAEMRSANARLTIELEEIRNMHNNGGTHD